MSNFDIKKVKETFARVFVLAVQNKINFQAFTKLLERSVFVYKIEQDQYDDYFNKRIENIYFDITGVTIKKDTSFGVYNDAYWCGYSYFELFIRTLKPFCLLFLKLPLSKMMEIYPIYHEMDISSLEEYFIRCDKEKTILRSLCIEKGCSLSKLSNDTNINKATLAKYNASDEAIYKGMFENIFKLAKYFNSPIILFSRKVIY